MDGSASVELALALPAFLEKWTECSAQEAQDATERLQVLGVTSARRLAFFPASRLAALNDVPGQVRCLARFCVRAVCM